MHSNLQLVNNFNSNYVGTLKVGSNDEEIRVIFDTGSANAWVLSTLCTKGECVNANHQRYNPKESTSHIASEQKAQINFGSGSLQGIFYTDTIKVPTVYSNSNDGGEATEITLKNQNFGAVTSEQVFNEDFDAIFGLAYP